MDAEPLPPNPAPSESNVYLTFCATIEQASAQRLANALAIATQHPKHEHVHLLFQSTGGMVSDGIFVYNLFKTFQKRLTIYNGGSVNSIALIAYLGATDRKVSKFGAFMWHRISRRFPNPATAGEINDSLKSLNLDDVRTADILKQYVTITDDQWANLGNNEFWFSADDAIKSGIATEFGDFAPTKGIPFYNV